MPSYKIIASGWVQGVGYRSHTSQCARALNLKGTVRNCQDGTVEIYVTGLDSEVDRLMLSLEKYPNPNNLTKLHKQAVESGVNYSGFEIVFDEGD
ncbi:MAG TPA: acylphosphatase [Gammaproteobacteria bacterium]|nr:acylphosphatase [Gammaproteobacteria bacterium]